MADENELKFKITGDAKGGLGDALKALGTTDEGGRGGLSRADRIVVDAFAKIVDSGEYAGDEIAEAFNAALGRVSKEGLFDLKLELQRAKVAGLIDERGLDKALDGVARKFEQVATAAEDAGRRVKAALETGGDAGEGGERKLCAHLSAKGQSSAPKRQSSERLSG